mgnify:CR=1 FL=1
MIVMNQYIRWLRYSLVVLACAVITSTTPLIIAAPVGSHDWLNNNYVLSSTLAPNTDYYTNRLCYDATVPVAGYEDPEEGCVFTGQNYELFRGYSFMAIRFGSESQFYEITTSGDEVLGRHWAYLVPKSNTLVHFQSVTDDSPYSIMTIYDNFTNKLVKTTALGHVTYSLVHATPNFVLHDSVGGVARVNPYTVSNSNSGRYILVDLMEGGIVRVDTLTHAQRAITGLKRHLSLDYAPWSTSMAASDDGKYVAVGGEYRDASTEIRVYQLSGDCGGEYVDMLSVADVCPKTSIQYEELQSVGLQLPARPAHLLYFDDTGNLSLYLDSYEPGYFPCTDSQDDDSCFGLRFKVSIGGTSTLASKLDYLAIGDSYTSGEGDLEGNGRYYLAGTGTNGGCHLSPRSYPFLLRSYWGVATSKMHSVACSGARVGEDYLSDISSYLGQSSQLKGLSLSNKSLRQDNALDQFTPGVVPQLEFIKKYKPKIVTVMGGGNDVGFKKVLEACASSFEVCSYAKNSFEKWSLDSQIDGFYNDTVRLLHAIKQSSPSSKVYVIGYPQFVKNGICILNSGLLNSEEITMINNSVSKFNAILARAAQNTGVAFVSTENSLAGGKLCEGSAYMTGAVNSLISTGNPASQSSFHPNAKGHQKMAESIKNQTGTKPPRLQGKDTYMNGFDSVILDKVAIVNYMTMTASSNITQGGPVQISLPPLSLLPDSLIQLFLHSDPIHLGTVTVNADGSVATTITLPANTPLGSHTLVLEGYSYSGEPLTYYEPVTALSNMPNDRDGDGILDQYDKCDFIPYWFDETTGKDLCAVDIPTQTTPTKQKAHNLPALSFDTTHQDTGENTIVNLLRNSDTPGPATTANEDTPSSQWPLWLGTGLLALLLVCIVVVVYSNHKKHYE